MAEPGTQHSVFVSYSRDSDDHKAWVLRLAQALQREPDIEVTFDQFDMWAGKDLTHFMERGLECERVIVVSTPEYVRKSTERVGGVGYESSLITADLVRDMKQDKFIPVLCEGDEVPSFLLTKFRVDFRPSQDYETALAKLLAAIRREGEAARPPKRASTASSGQIYIHDVPPPRSLLPARAHFGIEWGTNGFFLSVENTGDFPLYSTTVRLEFDCVPHFVIDCGDIGSLDKKVVPVEEVARSFGISARPIAQHIDDVARGHVEPRPDNRFLLTYVDTEGKEHASAFILQFDRKRGFELREVTVRIGFGTVR